MKPSRESIEAMKLQVVADIQTVRAGLLADRTLSPEEDEAMASIETFINVALRVMASVNASKVKDAMVAVEIQARMDGKHVYE